MGSLALNSLFTVAHFIKARCEHGLKAGELKDKNYIFFEVEILDYKTNKQLCFLDKVEPHATIKEIKSLLYKCYPKLYPARQSLKLHPNQFQRYEIHEVKIPGCWSFSAPNIKDTSVASWPNETNPMIHCAPSSFLEEGNALKDDDILENLPVGTTATMYFKDLGPQLGWTMVFLVEYIGPLFIYLLFYFRLPYIYSQKYTFTSSPYPVVPLACACHSFHYIKRLIETIFVHRFSHGTMPLRTMLKNCLYYWGFSAWLAYYINHPLYTPPSYGNQQVHYALLMFVLCEAGNFSINLTLNNMKTSGSLLTRFPYPTRNPFTWLFFFVSCPNYTYEVGTWIGFTIMTQCAPVAVFTLVGFIQMTIWARGKHKTYMQQFRDYPGLRVAIIPLFL